MTECPLHFDMCDSLTEISLPSTLKASGDYDITFMDSNDLQSVTVAAGNTDYASEDGVLYSADGSTLYLYPPAKQGSSFCVPETVTKLESRAFNANEFLEEITLSDALTCIGESAFSNCTSLTEMTIPAAVTSAKFAFQNCSSLEHVTFAEGSAMTEISSYMFYGCGITSITLPDTVTVIQNDAFHCCTELTSITLPSGLLEIGEGAFFKSGLTTLTLPDTVTTIGAYAFENCTSLQSITLPDTVTSIGQQAFSGTEELSIFQYKGTMEEWEAVCFGNNKYAYGEDGAENVAKCTLWNRNAGFSVITCSDGEYTI